MAASNLVVRAGVGAWTAVKYIITRGLDIGEAVAENPVDILRARPESRTIYGRAESKTLLARPENRILR